MQPDRLVGLYSIPKSKPEEMPGMLGQSAQQYFTFIKIRKGVAAAIPLHVQQTISNAGKHFQQENAGNQHCRKFELIEEGVFLE